ncbi:unnamed protein product [Auanema sp. JU1783]|nr:unnamed protein product [Auanema sp. JU1783]
MQSKTISLHSLSSLLGLALKKIIPLGHRSMFLKLTIDANILKPKMAEWEERLQAILIEEHSYRKATHNITSDALLTGYGAVFQNKTLAVTWTAELVPSEWMSNINILEIMVEKIAIRQFAKNLRSVHLAIHLHNRTAIAYINRRGGITNEYGTRIAFEIWDYCHSRNIVSGPSLQAPITKMERMVAE